MIIISTAEEKTINGVREDVWRKYKKTLKKERILEYAKMKQYFMTRKERRIAKQKLNKPKR